MLSLSMPQARNMANRSARVKAPPKLRAFGRAIDDTRHPVLPNSPAREKRNMNWKNLQTLRQATMRRGSRSSGSARDPGPAVSAPPAPSPHDDHVGSAQDRLSARLSR